MATDGGSDHPTHGDTKIKAMTSQRGSIAVAIPNDTDDDTISFGMALSGADQKSYIAELEAVSFCLERCCGSWREHRHRDRQ